ncbi:MAG: hypothetical protein ABFQ95_02765 [Pseudomonadota bacterium]
MYRKALILAGCVALAGCAAERTREDDPWARTGPDWAEDCQKFFSETPYEYAGCVARVEAKRAADPGSGPRVGLKDQGTRVGQRSEIKEAEPGDAAIMN